MSTTFDTSGIPAFNQLKLSNGTVERLKQGLYDTLLYGAAGATSLQFFALPIGQGLSVQQGAAAAGMTKQLADTNMTLAGQLPKGQAYVAESIELNFEPGSVSTANIWAPVALVAFNAAASATVTAGLADINAILMAGVLTFSIMSKNYLTEGPIGRFPPKTHKVLNAAVANTSTTTGEVLVANMYSDGRPYYLEVPLPIEDGQNFAATLAFPVAVACPSGFNGQIKCTLDGQLYRASQ